MDEAVGTTSNEDRLTVGLAAPALQQREWPPVPAWSGPPDGFDSFLQWSQTEQQDFLTDLRDTSLRHSEILHRYLGTVSSYLFGYRDSPAFRRADDQLELALLRAKLVLERELLDNWLDSGPTPPAMDQAEAVVYLEQLSRRNPCLEHPLFPFLRDYADRAALRRFVLDEVIRNEVVDDEVAMMLAGLQGSMKAAIASNLWDECGRGNLRNFHTYWLRRALDALGDWDNIVSYRRLHRLWFTAITTNVFNVLLTRPGLRLMAYGWFLINESWVAPHFGDIVGGLRRVGLDDEGVLIYFEAHRVIDPRHTSELASALREQVPPLGPVEVQQVITGAHLAISATAKQYGHVYRYLRDFSS